MRKAVVVTAMAMALAVMGFYPNECGADCCSQEGSEVKIMKLVPAMKIGSDEANEDFHKPRAFDIDRKGRIFILDSGNRRVQCFSPEGRFLFSFGKAGQGPGEFSEGVDKIKIIENGDLYVFDGRTFKINIYDELGRFKRLIKAGEIYDDVEVIDGETFVSHILLKDDHLPIHVLNNGGEVVRSFGLVIEPSVGILRQVQSLKYPQGIDVVFSGFTSLAVNSKNQIIYSQKLPYHIVSYEPDSRIANEVIGDTDYDVRRRFSVIERDGGDTRGLRSVSPLPQTFTPKIIVNDEILVPFINPEKDDLYIDRYTQNLKRITRHKGKISIVDIKKRDVIRQARMGNDDSIYFLVEYEDECPQLLKYDIIFE